MKVLITGAFGQVGQFIAWKFKLAGWQVFAPSHRKLDICNEEAVRKFVFTIKPQLVINAAAYTAVDKAEKKPDLAYQINAVAPGYLSATAKKVGAVIIHISTDYVFDGCKKGAYEETDQPYPINVYGASKLVGEHNVISDNPHHIIFRTSWVFSEYGSNFAKTMLRLASECSELSIVTDQFGGPTYAGDIADALVNIAHKVTNISDFYGWGIYHYCGMPYLSWYQFANVIFAHASQTGAISTVPETHAIFSAEYTSLALRPQNSTLNCSKIKTVFALNQPDWQQSLDIMLTSFQHRKLLL